MKASGFEAAPGGEAISVACRHGPDEGLASTMVCALPEESWQLPAAVQDPSRVQVTASSSAESGEAAPDGSRGVNARAHLPWDSVAMNPCRLWDLPYS